MPTIRVDDEVYAWLQSNARPFEDTPNSVLRRLAGIDTAPTATKTPRGERKSTMQTRVVHQGRIGLSGRQLNEEWKVGARHALFSRDGCWYENLERFPGALFDQNGYVLFRTAEEYRNSPRIKVGKKTNIANGISSLPGYVRKS